MPWIRTTFGPALHLNALQAPLALNPATDYTTGFSGWYTDGGTNSTAANDNYLAGNLSGVNYADFLVYDLSGISQEILADGERWRLRVPLMARWLRLRGQSSRRRRPGDTTLGKCPRAKPAGLFQGREPVLGDDEFR